MKKRTQRKVSKPNASSKRQRPKLEALALDSAPVPGGPPLEGEALEVKVAEAMCAGFRATDARVSLRSTCGGAEQAAIESAIVSPRVKSVVESVAQAFAIEQTIAVIRLLLCNARAALEVEKPTPAQITALKIVFESVVEKMLERIGGGMWKESTGLLGFSDYEMSLIENLVQLVRGQRTPVAEAPQRAPDSAEFAETGE